MVSRSRLSGDLHSTGYLYPGAIVKSNTLAVIVRGTENQQTIARSCGMLDCVRRFTAEYNHKGVPWGSEVVVDFKQ